jgi:hypothetical protein
MSLGGDGVLGRARTKVKAGVCARIGDCLGQSRRGREVGGRRRRRVVSERAQGLCSAGALTTQRAAMITTSVLSVLYQQHHHHLSWASTWSSTWCCVWPATCPSATSTTLHPRTSSTSPSPPRPRRLKRIHGAPALFSIPASTTLCVYKYTGIPLITKSCCSLARSSSRWRCRPPSTCGRFTPLPDE